MVIPARNLATEPTLLTAMNPKTYAPKATTVPATPHPRLLALKSTERA
ncbi:hypothetical protein [Pyrococcus yayanosii]|uniref:Uncharacterized protein n=1 Tax=Pyrococcus yayanosii (strain CH1 / JCM 16557) TaxID=529709 RepID=F8AFR9_PYRYC|nr:hypothetical protein [Pyrococcus yayanosii]AEH23820.1 hypothetical protein PYCH_01110 [Pyrococcus yayanosii CH1]